MRTNEETAREMFELILKGCECMGGNAGYKILITHLVKTCEESKALILATAPLPPSRN